jgi:transposase-like protein
MRKRRNYSDEEKAECLAVLDVNKGNVKRTSRVMDVPRSTLRQWKNNQHLSKGVAKLHTNKKEELHKRFESVVYLLVDGMTEETIKEMSGLQIMIAAGILVDKMILLRQ